MCIHVRMCALVRVLSLKVRIQDSYFYSMATSSGEVLDTSNSHGDMETTYLGGDGYTLSKGIMFSRNVNNEIISLAREVLYLQITAP